MKKFRFSLEAALRWRQLKAEQEKAKVEAIAAEIGRIDAAKLALDDEKQQADRSIKQAGSASAGDLHAFDAYVRHAAQRRVMLEGRKVEVRRRLSEQQSFYVDARREAELLEKLKARHRAAWERESDRELETWAGEAYLAKLIREAAPEDE